MVSFLLTGKGPFIADRLMGSSQAAQIIATEMLLGILFKQLYTTPLFILNIIISSSVFS
jgi:hypothetical protein